jgi:hypothetical protein
MAKLGSTYESRTKTMEYYLYHCEIKIDVQFVLEVFYKRVIENQDSILELFTFLALYCYFSREVDVFLSNYSEKRTEIIERCSKILGKFRNGELLEQDYDCAIMAAFFLAKYHSFWRGLKPLLIAFRNSKQALLTNDLSSNDRLVTDIMGFFDFAKQNYPHNNLSLRQSFLPINDDDLKQLRQDMANDFADYLKPLKLKERERQAENYTEYEQAEPGFDLHYKEPSAFWRYAYVRAIVDLGVKTDGQEHFFHETLKKTAENDPSEMVRKAAVKADRELNRWREGFNSSEHKRKLYEAFWWLRLAHLLSLGMEIDEAASKRLRVQEWRDRW